MEACVTSYGDGMKRTDSSLVLVRHESICCKSWKRLHILSLFALTWTAVSIATFSLWQCIELKEQNAQISMQLQQMKSHFSEENALHHHESMIHLADGSRHRQHQVRTPASASVGVISLLHGNRRRRSNADIEGRSRNEERTKQRNLVKVAHFQRNNNTDLKVLTWNRTDWNKVLPNNHSLNCTLTDHGNKVRIEENGFYYVYAQIHFENSWNRNAFAVMVEEGDGSDRAAFKCIQSTDFYNSSLSSHENRRIKQCYTSGLLPLKRHQVIYIKNLYPRRILYEELEASHWGLMKLFGF